jgi:hypothetical protein
MGASCSALGIYEEYSMSRGAPTWWMLLIIEPFSQSKLNKIKTENYFWNLEVFLVLVESPWRVRFNKVYFTIFRAKVWKILIFEWILLVFLEISILKIWKIKNVFTLGLTTQATLVAMKEGSCLFGWDLSNPGASHCALDIFRKLLMSKGPLYIAWICNVLIYNVRDIEYWMTFSLKIN